MGCLCSCLSLDYKALEEDGQIMHEVLGEGEYKFDPEASIFKGCPVEQKFIGKLQYEQKFVWVNYPTKTIHLSEHMTKERRHKEASLDDVTDVVAGPPSKLGNNSKSIDGDLCLTIQFKRGGGIDLKFSSSKDRNEWFDVLHRIVMQRNSLS